MLSSYNPSRSVLVCQLNESVYTTVCGSLLQLANRYALSIQRLRSKATSSRVRRAAVRQRVFLPHTSDYFYTQSVFAVDDVPSSIASLSINSTASTCRPTTAATISIPSSYSQSCLRINAWRHTSWRHRLNGATSGAVVKSAR